MKFLVPLFILGLTLVSCSSEPSVEDDLYACLVSEFENDGIDLEKLLDELEDQMVTEGILSGKNGQAKVDYFEKIIETGVIPPLKDYKVLDKLRESKDHRLFLNVCHEKIAKKDSVRFEKSRFNAISKKIKGRLKKEGSFSIVSISEVLISELSADDFEHPYFRAFVLIGFGMMADKDTAYIREIPKRIKPEPSADPAGISIYLRRNDSVIVNNKTIHFDELSNTYEKLKRVVDRKAPVYLYVSNDVKYATFIGAQSVIENYSIKIRNEEAKRSFHKPYDDLNALQKSQVDEEHPMLVIERKY